MSYSSNIIPKDCSYGCNTRIYWDNSQNTFLDVLSKQKHVCPNRQQQNIKSTNTTTTTAATSKPTYNNKRPWSNTTQPKPKMSNSFELLTGPIETVQEKYEVLSDIVAEYGGKVHGSQRDRDPKTGLLDLLYTMKFH